MTEDRRHRQGLGRRHEGGCAFAREPAVPGHGRELSYCDIPRKDQLRAASCWADLQQQPSGLISDRSEKDRGDVPLCIRQAVIYDRLSHYSQPCERKEHGSQDLPRGRHPNETHSTHSHETQSSGTPHSFVDRGRAVTLRLALPTKLLTAGQRESQSPQLPDPTAKHQGRQ